jgi:hypothetical protein
MGALQGNYQRNVGNYQTAFKGLGEKVDGFAKGLTALKGGANGAKGALDAMSKTPALAVTGLLVGAISSLVSSFKESEEGTKALQAGMANLQPIMDLIKGIVSKLTEILGNVISKVSNFLGSSGLINKIINGVMGVGNAVVQYVIAPFKAVISAIKVFKEEGIKGFRNAAKAFGTEIKSGVSFKKNFETGQAFAETLIAGAKSKKKKAKDTGKSLGKDLAKGMEEGLSEADIAKMIEADLDAIEKSLEEANKAAVKSAEERLKSLDKWADHRLELNSILVEDDKEREEKEYKIQEEANKKKLELLDKYMDEALDRTDLDAYAAFAEEKADLEVEIETNALKEKKRLREQDLKDAEEKTKAQKELLKGVASSTSSILGAIADLFEEDEENAEKNADKIKALRIAAATIDTISGAIGAYMQAAASIPPPMGQILGAVSAAAVTAAGIAQIAKIKNTKVSGSSGNPSVTTPAMTAAPTLTTQVSNVRNVTSSSEEDRLNQMASNQRVYILSSDIEASQTQRKVQVAESTF